MKEKKIYPKFTAQASGGRLYLENEAAFSNYLLGLNGKTVEVVVKIPHKHRSRQEEKFYHGVVVRLIAEAMSAEDQEAHDLLRGMFLKYEERTPAGIRYERTLSTTELSDQAYREYWEKCIRWAAQPTKISGLAIDSGLGLYIPYPNECDYENY